MFGQYFIDLWNADLAISGKSLLTFMVFNITFMLMGRFRFNLIAGLSLTFYLLFFENRPLIDKYFDDTGLAAMFVVSGVVFLTLSIWSFFIDAD